MRRVLQFSTRIVTPSLRNLSTMPFDQTAIRLDSLIQNLENELGVRSVSINPDDPWATYRLQNYKNSPLIQIKQCSNCTYKLALPFEVICPSCGFKGKSLLEQFALPTPEQMKASLPKEKPEPAPKQAAKKSEAKPAASAKPESGAPKAAEPAKPAEPAASPEEILAAWKKCSIQVSKIESIEVHPTAAQLYVIQLDAGEANKRQVCAGLVNYYKPEELVGRLVVTVMNLKAAKLRGVLSSAMILAGSHNGQVRTVEPPANSAVGDAVYLEGDSANKEKLGTLNSKTWKTVADNFKVKGGKAVVADKTVVTEKGACTVPDLPDGSEIH